MPVLPTLAVVLATVAATLSPAGPDATASAPRDAVVTSDVPADRVPDVDDAVQGEALPLRPRVPNGALLVGADQDHALYHSNHVDPTTDQLDYTLISLADGHVVRTVRGPRTPCCADVDVRLVDGAIIMGDEQGAIVRYDALTGEVTGRISSEDAYGHLVLDDQWVLTATAVRWFDGRVVPLERELGPSRFPNRLGDSDLAVLTATNGDGPVVLTPSTGEVVELARPGDWLRVFAVRGGPRPEVFGQLESSADGEHGLVRWTDPARAQGRTVVESSFIARAGGFAGDRLVASVVVDNGVRADSVVEIDRETAEMSEPLVDDVLAELQIGSAPRVPGQVVVQAGNQVLVSRGADGVGELRLLTATATRSLGAPRPSPLSAGRVYRSEGLVEAEFRDNRRFDSTASITVGDAEWTQVSTGPLILPVGSIPLGTHRLARCSDAAVPRVMAVRDRWQLERCPGGREWFVTDRLERLDPLAVDGTAQLGSDHVVQQITEVRGHDIRAALLVTGLDVRRRTRVYGPLGFDFSVDHVGDQDPVYVDPAGTVRLAPASGMADTAPPSITVVRHPADHVSAVRATRLSYAATARDAVDGSRVAVQVQTRRALAGQQTYSAWRTATASGTLSVTAKPGEQWCFRTAAVDRSGNIARSDARCSIVPVDDRAAVTYGAARRVTGDYLGGGATVVDRPGAAISARTLVDSQSVVWLRTGPSRGQAVVTVGDEVVQRIETYARTPGLRAVVLSPVGRRLKIGAATSRPVVVDAIGQLRPS